MIYAKNVFRAIIAISSVATAAHATPAAPRTNTWNEFSEGPGHGANGQGPRGFASRLLDTLNTYGGTGATANAVASPSNYGGKKKGQVNALRGVDSPRNDSKFATASPIGTPKNGKQNQNIKTPCPNSVKTAHQQVPVVPATTAPTPCPYSNKTPATAAPAAHGNADGNKQGGKDSYCNNGNNGNNGKSSKSGSGSGNTSNGTPPATQPSGSGAAGPVTPASPSSNGNNGNNGNYGPAPAAGGAAIPRGNGYVNSDIIGGIGKGNAYANSGGNKKNYEPAGQSVTNAGANWDNVYSAPVSAAKSPAQTQSKKKAY